ESPPQTPDQRISIERVDGVAEIRLNRPDKMNALDPAMFDALIAAGETLQQDADVRAVVLSGEGKGFCAGLDMGLFQSMV
ncbi:enoyl-CoA hydratase-related protein, partial [Acinetobacter baumannii]